MTSMNFSISLLQLTAPARRELDGKRGRSGFLKLLMKHQSSERGGPREIPSRWTWAMLFLPVPGMPDTKILYPWFLMEIPNSMAETARAWPITSSVGFSSSVVAKANSADRRYAEFQQWVRQNP